MDRPKPWEEDNDYIDGHGTFYRNSTITRSQPYINYNSMSLNCFLFQFIDIINYYLHLTVVSSLRHIPKPGYGLKSNTIQPVTNVTNTISYVFGPFLLIGRFILGT